MKYYFLIITAIILSSCFKHEIEINDDITKLLSVNIQIDAQSDTSYVSIGHTIPLDELTNEITDVSDVEAVIIFPDGERYAFEHRTEIQGFNFWLYNTPPFQVGKEYYIEVNKPGYPPLKGRATMPENVELDSFQLFNQITMGFQDPPEKNYYEVFGNHGLVLALDWNNPNASNFYKNSTYLVQDDGFNGLFQVFNIPVLGIFSTPKPWVFNFSVISEDIYLYEKSIRLQEESKRNPFLGTFVTHSNVENGIGIFSFKHVNSYR